MTYHAFEGDCIERGGYGGVIRTTDGKYIIGWYGYLVSGTNLFCNLLEMWHGLNIAYCQGVRNMCVQTDSEAAFEDLANMTDRGDPNYELRTNCHSFMANGGHELLIVAPEENNIGQAMSKFGASSDSRYCYCFDMPTQLCSTLRELGLY